MLNRRKHAALFRQRVFCLLSLLRSLLTSRASAIAFDLIDLVLSGFAAVVAAEMFFARDRAVAYFVFANFDICHIVFSVSGMVINVPALTGPPVQGLKVRPGL